MTDIKLKPRSSFWLTRFLNLFGGNTMWTTIGDTIYFPDLYTLDEAGIFTEIIEHEKVHIEQFEKYGIFGFLFLYILIPLPAFLSYFRWKFEREAYLVDIKCGHLTTDQVVETLHCNYVRPWPKSWMKSWFEKNI